jgi:hypothetical protein
MNSLNTKVICIPPKTCFRKAEGLTTLSGHHTQTEAQDAIITDTLVIFSALEACNSATPA